MTDGRAIAYSEREREFTFANNDALVRFTYQQAIGRELYSARLETER